MKLTVPETNPNAQTAKDSPVASAPAEKSEPRALQLAVATALMWSTVSSAFKLILEHATPIALLLVSQCVAVVIVFVYLLWRRQLRALRSANAAAWRRSLLLGLLNPFAYYLVLFEAYARLPAQIAQPLNCTWSVVLALLAVPVLKQRLSGQVLVGLLLSYCGVLISVTGGTAGFALQYDAGGVALALGSTLIWSVYWLLTARDTRPGEVVLAMNLLCGLPFTIAWCLITQGLPSMHLSLLVGGLWVGAFEMGFAFLTWLAALRLTRSAARVSQLALLSPLLAPVWISLVLHEPLHAASLAGLLLIVAGAALAQRARQDNVASH